LVGGSFDFVKINTNKMDFINWNDEKISLGKRKVAFVKWAMKQGTPKINAQRIANKKFGWEFRCPSCGKKSILKDSNTRFICPHCGWWD
jgi:predicted RNA-binding Zn-ribbon protein involved in translation (DUF1610 family)